MSNALVLVALALTAAAIVRSDSHTALSKLELVYLGRSSLAEDPRYASLAQALERLPPDLRERVRLHHVPALPLGSRLEQAVTEAIAMNPTVIVAPSTATAKAVRRRKAGISVVFSCFTDPVRTGVVSSTMQREEPFAGVWMADDLDAKRLELLRDAYPNVRKVAVLMDRPWADNSDALRRLPAQAQSLGLNISIFIADDLNEARRWLNAPQAQSFDAWYLAPTGMANLYASPILDALRHMRKPVIVGDAQLVRNGAPLSYMIDDSFRWPAMVDLLTRVLRGEPAGSIPVQRPDRTLLTVRQSPAEGFPAPSPEILLRADTVIR